MAATLPQQASVFLPFLNRQVAAEALADRLAAYAGRRPLVLGIPPGGAVVGRELADRLAGDLDVVLVGALRDESRPECALGAIDETGWIHCDAGVPSGEAQRRHLVHEAVFQRSVLAERAAVYRSGRRRLETAGRTVIVADEGMATAGNMIEALRAVRARGAVRLVCAVPVASRDALRAVEPWADEVVCVVSPLQFDAVARFYRDFRPLRDDQVAAALQRAPHLETA